MLILKTTINAGDNKEGIYFLISYFITEVFPLIFSSLMIFPFQTTPFKDKNLTLQYFVDIVSIPF